MCAFIGYARQVAKTYESKGISLIYHKPYLNSQKMNSIDLYHDKMSPRWSINYEGFSYYIHEKYMFSNFRLTAGWTAIPTEGIARWTAVETVQWVTRRTAWLIADQKVGEITGIWPAPVLGIAVKNQNYFKISHPTK